MLQGIMGIQLPLCRNHSNRQFILRNIAVLSPHFFGNAVIGAEITHLVGLFRILWQQQRIMAAIPTRLSSLELFQECG